ncbi:MAG TPA: M64 family metallopeptidase [Candidatus Polarisedimenticolaceae bacterium]|nr:M64 family metallopeptidase [Candidatus Polarisedimenticolaceae bacterium]
MGLRTPIPRITWRPPRPPGIPRPPWMGAGGAGPLPPATVPPRGLPAPFLGLLLRDEGPAWTVLAHELARRSPGTQALRPPRIVTSKLQDLPMGATEEVAAVLDATGRILNFYAWDGKPRVFSDYRAGSALRGVSSRPPVSTVRVSIPITANAAFVVIYRARVVADPQAPGGRGIARTQLLSMALRLSGGGPVAMPAPFSREGPVQGLVASPAPTRLDLDVVREVTGGGPPLAMKSSVEPGGRVIPNEMNRFADRDGAERYFDVLFVAEGFTEAEMGTYQGLVENVIDGFFKAAPFSQAKHKLQFHIVKTASNESGITGHPDRTTKRSTYFHVESNSEERGSECNYLIPYPDLIQRAATEANLSVSWSEIDLTVMLVNAQIDGGHADPGQKLIVASEKIGYSGDPFINVVLHEAGHAIAGLAEEYVSCIAWEERDEYPNLATQQQRLDGAVPWKDLAKKAKHLTAAGDFKTVYEPPRQYDAFGNPTGLKNREGSRIGLFWGCQCTSKAKAHDACGGFNDPDAAAFYRPMARCRMRSEADEFCKVCADAIEQRIIAAFEAGPADDEEPGVSVDVPSESNGKRKTRKKTARRKDH